MRLHVLPPSPRALKVLAVCAELGLAPEIKVVDFSRSEQTSSEFARLNPNRRMPVLEDGDCILWESNAIIAYLALKAGDQTFFPTELRAQANVLRWMFWEASQWDPVWDILITERLKRQVFQVRHDGRRTAGLTNTPQPPDLERLAAGVDEMADLCAVLETQLTDTNWLCGRHKTPADFAVGAWLTAAPLVAVDLTTYPAIGRWFQNLMATRGWREALKWLAPPAREQLEPVPLRSDGPQE